MDGTNEIWKKGNDERILKGQEEGREELKERGRLGRHEGEKEGLREKGRQEENVKKKEKL